MLASSLQNRAAHAAGPARCAPAQRVRGVLPSRVPRRANMSVRASGEPLSVPEDSQLAQLAKMTTLSIDTGDLSIIRRFAATGLITDATTNPLFVSQAAMRGDEPEYADLVARAVAAAKEDLDGGPPTDGAIKLAMDYLSVFLGAKISEIVPGYVSTEVDVRLSFDATATCARAMRIIALYEAAGVDRSRILIKVAATWPGINAARGLARLGIKTNVTLVFGVCQAILSAQAGATLISPFPGRVLEWTRKNVPDGPQAWAPADDPGVVSVRDMYAYLRKFDHDTICMPASWRSSTGNDMLDEVRALAGIDRMTIPPPLLEKLAECREPLPRSLDPQSAAALCQSDGHEMGESEFKWALAMDAAANDKLAEALRAFAGDTDRLVDALRAHPGWN